MRSLGLHVVVEPAASLHDVERAVCILVGVRLRVRVRIRVGVGVGARVTRRIAARRRASGGYTYYGYTYFGYTYYGYTCYGYTYYGYTSSERWVYLTWLYPLLIPIHRVAIGWSVCDGKRMALHFLLLATDSLLLATY
jgi:hypothetical protein